MSKPKKPTIIVESSSESGSDDSDFEQVVKNSSATSPAKAHSSHASKVLAKTPSKTPTKTTNKRQSSSSSSSEEESDSDEDDEPPKKKTSTTTPSKAQNSIKTSVTSASAKKSSKSPAKTNTKDSGALADWKPDDVKALVDQLKSLLENDRASIYSRSMKSVDWSKIEVPGKSSIACKEAAANLIRKVRRYRTIHEVLMDVETLVESNKFKRNINPDLPKQPTSPFFRYYNDKRETLQKMFPNMSVTELSTKASEMFQKLPEYEQKKYIEPYERERKAYQEAMERFNKEHPDLVGSKPGGKSQNKPKSKSGEEILGPKLPQTPFQLYLKAKREDGEEFKVAQARCKKDWAALPDEKIRRWIKKAIKDFSRYEEEVSEYQKINPNYEMTKSEPPLNQRELQILDDEKGVPRKFPLNSFAWFISDGFEKIHPELCLSEMNPAEKSKKAREIWKDISKEDKKLVDRMYAQETVLYVEKVKKYLETLPNDEKVNFLTNNKIPAVSKYDSARFSPIKASTPLRTTAEPVPLKSDKSKKKR